LTAVTGSRPSPEVVDAVVDRTEGNAFFIEELVAADGLDGRPMPESLRDLLLVRTQALTSEAQELLRYASAAGRHVDHRLLAAVSGMSAREITELLREIVARQLLVPEGDGYRFRHALLREALHMDLLPGERGPVHASYARALAQAPDLGGASEAAATAELAYHWQQAGDLDKAMEAWIEAGRAAEQMFAFAEARHHFEQALAVWDRVPDAIDLAGAPKVQMLRRAAEDAFLGGDPDRAGELARRAIALVDPEADPMLAGVLHDRLARYVWDTSEQSTALDIYQTAVELVPADPPSAERARVLASLGGHLMVLGRYGEARRVSEEALAMARAVASEGAEYFALNTLGTITCTLDDVDEGLRLLERALHMAEAHGDAQEQMRGHWNIFSNLQTAGRWELAVLKFGVAADALPRLGMGHLVAPLEVSAADCLFRLGRWPEADRMIENARSRQQAGEDPIRLPELDIARGDFEVAAAYLGGRREDERVVDLSGLGWLRMNLAELAVWQRRYDDAREAVEEGLALLVDFDDPSPAAYLCAAGLRGEADRANEARVLRRDDELDAARRVGARLLENMRELTARPGPADGWKREVGALSAQCEAEGTRLHRETDPDVWARSVDTWERLSMPYPAAYGRWRQAGVLLDSGATRERVQHVLRTAHDSASALGAKPLLEGILVLARRARIALAPEDRAPGFAEDILTPRERDVLELVAVGRSNRQIAESLFISEKTASVHVSNILRKLQVSRRGEAAAAAYQRGLVG
ncbi:MAG: ATP-binding protein, partial [Actinomycetota bacterium]